MPMGPIEHTTRDHDEIRRWIEGHDGVPAIVPSAAGADGAGGVLHIDFPQDVGGKTARVSWAEWFATFDSRRVAFSYQDPVTGGQESPNCKLVETCEPDPFG